MTPASNSDSILDRLGEDIRFGADGFNSDGLCSRGYDRDGFYPNGWNINGINRVTATRFDASGWSEANVHKLTGTRFTPRVSPGLRRCHPAMQTDTTTTVSTYAA